MWSLRLGIPRSLQVSQVPRLPGIAAVGCAEDGKEGMRAVGFSVEGREEDFRPGLGSCEGLRDLVHFWAGSVTHWAGLPKLPRLTRLSMVEAD